MKLYIKNIDINNINLKNIEQYKHKITRNNYIISNNIICQVKNNNLYKINQIDYPIIEFKLNNYDILVDKSYWKQENQLMHVNNNNIILTIITQEYIINTLDQIKLVIEYKLDNHNYILYNFYFLLNNIISNPKELEFYNIEIIDTFLSLLTNIN
jgi:hypothetical protein